MILNFIAVLLSTHLWAANFQAKIQYEKSINQTNDLVEESKDILNCPGTQLVISCGNQFCEPHLNESQTTCPADCLPNVTVRSYNNITLCQGYNEIQIPQSSLEVSDIVKKAVFEKKHVRAIGASHSATDVMCASGLLVPMDKMKTIFGIETLNNQKIIHAQAGVTVFELSEWLHQKGYALAGLPHMGFRDVTIGGAIATGSHGSTPKHHGVISNIIEAIQLVDGKGEIHNFTKAETNASTFKALSASLGLLGITTEFKLRIRPQFNLGVQISYHDQEEILSKGLTRFIQDCDYAQYNWFPGIKKMMKTCGKKSNQPANLQANNELLSPAIPDFVVKPFKKILQFGACENKIMCALEQVRWWQYELQPPMVVTNSKGKKSFKRYLVGPSHRMVSSHLTKNQNGFFQMDWEIAVPASQSEAAFRAIANHVEKNKTCLPLVGVFIRFAPAEDETLIAHTVANGTEWKKGETAVFFEMPVYVPVGFSQEQFKAYEKQFEEFTSMLITQFSGRPHWGKNRQWAFDLAMKQNSYGSQFREFKSVMNELDPEQTFINDFGKKLGL